MNHQELLSVFVTTANRIAKRQYKYFDLDRKRISEAEACHVMTKVLAEFKYRYGIERRSKEIYKANVGLVDLAIFDKKKGGAPIGWVEFKRGVASEPKIRKDFEKMMKEHGLNIVSFFHIIPKPEKGTKKEDRNTVDAVLSRYAEAYEKAYKEAMKAKISPAPKEFVFFLLECEKDRYFYNRFENILEKVRFGIPKWNQLGYDTLERRIRWISGKVDTGNEHIKLFFGNAEEKGWNEFELVALLSPPVGSACRVQFINKNKDAEHEAMRRDVKAELNYYLIELEKEDPWSYAIYHCTTAANIYSNVHWAYYRRGNSTSAMRSKVVRDGKRNWIFKPEAGPSKPK